MIQGVSHESPRHASQKDTRGMQGVHGDARDGGHKKREWNTMNQFIALNWIHVIIVTSPPAPAPVPVSARCTDVKVSRRATVGNQ